jgi:hypothetical protein
MMDTPDMGAAALALANFGYAMLPVHTTKDGVCSCGNKDCKSPGKHPRTKNGVKDATRDPAKIAAWWRKSPNANIGIATGVRGGIVVLDLDGPDAEVWLAANELTHGSLPATVEVATARGRHLYFMLPPSTGIPCRTGIGPKVDARGDDGYVVAPPSLHANGVRYDWQGADECADAPPWLLSLIGSAAKPAKERVATGGGGQYATAAPDPLGDTGGCDPRPPYRGDYHADLWAALSQIPADDRQTWLTIGMALHSLTQAEGWGDRPKETWDKWSATCPEKFDEADQHRTWDSFEPKAPGDGIGIATAFYLAREHGWTGTTPEGPASPRGSAAPSLPPAPIPPTPGARRSSCQKAPPQRELIIEAVQNAGVIFWRDADGNAYATAPIGGTLRRYRLRSRAFGLLVRSIFGRANPAASRNGSTRPGSVSESALAEAIGAFNAMAMEGDIMEPAVRVLRSAESIILDLGDDAWRAVVVTEAGWQMVEKTSAPLIRPDGMRPLPVPQRDPDALAKLRALLNLPSGPEGDADFRLVVMWCLACLWPTGPYPVLALDGEQGSAKSTTCRILRRLVDPNAGELRAPPSSEDDLLIAAMNGRVVAADNVSYIERDMADALCRLATGGGFGKRKLYADTDEIIVSVARPVLLNGIPVLLARGDLADRALAITLPMIPDELRRPESEVWAAFGTMAPGGLAVLLDGLAMALRRLPGLRLPHLPRMADFARLAVSAAPAFGWEDGDVLDAIARNREAAVAAMIDADPIADAVRSIGQEHGKWQGTATMLLDEINKKVPLEAQRERGWPKDATRISTRLTRVVPALRRAGVDVSTDRAGHGGKRVITIQTRTIGKLASPASAASPQHRRNGDAADAADADYPIVRSVPAARSHRVAGKT